jgi:hypothetical protein
MPVDYVVNLVRTGSEHFGEPYLDEPHIGWVARVECLPEHFLKNLPQLLPAMLFA